MGFLDKFFSKINKFKPAYSQKKTRSTKEKDQIKPINKTEPILQTQAKPINKTEPILQTQAKPINKESVSKDQQEKQSTDQATFHSNTKSRYIKTNSFSEELSKNHDESPVTNVTKLIDIEGEEDTLVMQEQQAKKSPASLLLLNGPKDMVGLSWPLVNPVTGVGRSFRLNEVPIDHNSLSKTHFQILKENDKFYLVDLKSTNKTYMNNKLLEPYQKTKLENNAYIRASSLIFKFLDQGNIEFFSSMQALNKSQTDPLTGAGNRQLLKVKGNEYFLSKKTLSLIVFDIDNFKQINDNYGHSAGDHVLKMLSKYILQTIRDGDMFIRYGGDEFCLFTPNSLSVATSIADRIKQTVQTSNFIFQNQKLNIDISIGVAEREEGDKAWENIYQRADKKSYEQKRRKKSIKSS